MMSPILIVCRSAAKFFSCRSAALTYHHQKALRPNERLRIEANLAAERQDQDVRRGAANDDSCTRCELCHFKLFTLLQIDSDAQGRAGKKKQTHTAGLDSCRFCTIVAVDATVFVVFPWCNIMPTALQCTQGHTWEPDIPSGLVCGC